MLQKGSRKTKFIVDRHNRDFVEIIRHMLQQALLGRIKLRSSG